VKLRVADTPHLFITELRTRMPFRYGIATLTALPHLFVEMQLEIDGKAHRGAAAENLAPKWFTKNPDSTPQQDIAEMLTVIRSACGFAASAGEAASVFELWRTIYDEQSRWGAAENLPPLLVNFGTTLIERAMIDAFCRATGQTFADAARTNSLGLPEPAVAELPPQPLRSLIVRHTIGLSDPLTDAQATLNDGLPQSLESCVRAYGLSHFKIKIGGDISADVQRLREIASLLGDADVNVRFTLDGNESYRDLDAFRAFWAAVRDERFIRTKMLFVEQPLHRDVAFTAGLERWSDRPPIIIDESDAEIDSFALALSRGYAGTSFKSCKGVFKGMFSASLARRRGGNTIISAEDLTTIGPVSLMQDLAVVATLGIPHVERNGHHYFRGLSMFPRDVQRQVLVAHGDLYRDIGFPTLDIRGGAIAIDSVVDAPFGYAINDLDLASNFREIT
jgi:hypothetical protein